MRHSLIVSCSDAFSSINALSNGCCSKEKYRSFDIYNIDRRQFDVWISKFDGTRTKRPLSTANAFVCCVDCFNIRDFCNGSPSFFILCSLLPNVNRIRAINGESKCHFVTNADETFHFEKSPRGIRQIENDGYLFGIDFYHADGFVTRHFFMEHLSLSSNESFLQPLRKDIQKPWSFCRLGEISLSLFFIGSSFPRFEIPARYWE